MVRVDAKEYSERWNSRIKGSTETIRKGVERVKEAPGVSAAKQAEKMKANLIKSIDSGKWGSRVSAVTLEKWKDDILNKGIGRIAQGADSAKEDVQNFAEQFIPHLERVQNDVSKMPSLTLEDNIQRMVKNTRELAKFHRK